MKSVIKINPQPVTNLEVSKLQLWLGNPEYQTLKRVLSCQLASLELEAADLLIGSIAEGEVTLAEAKHKAHQAARLRDVLDTLDQISTDDPDKFYFANLTIE